MPPKKGKEKKGKEKDKDKKPRKVYQIPVGGSNGLGKIWRVRRVQDMVGERLCIIRILQQECPTIYCLFITPIYCFFSMN